MHTTCDKFDSNCICTVYIYMCVYVCMCVYSECLPPVFILIEDFLGGGGGGSSGILANLNSKIS